MDSNHNRLASVKYELSDLCAFPGYTQPSINLFKILYENARMYKQTHLLDHFQTCNPY